ncbi:Hypothetical predicted protein [Lecanosticta acicola]|uniref:Heterokaryon incompatibility domain-containing protein n=1 Tax=Lecanosticta acicola TaxID=111012 RepID=A0AAI8Z7H0_9PEZI|nr:Hypothetical predicted protein [Lecanosticta acicola]
MADLTAIAAGKHQIVLLRYRPVPVEPEEQYGPRHKAEAIRFPKHIVRLSTERTELQSAPSYVALSYAWGDPGITEVVEVDGAAVNVTANLATALEHLQDKIEDNEALWIDALCIDQENEAEKSSQVARMRDVYTNATRVLAWLGPDVDGPDLGCSIAWLMDFGLRAVTLGIGNSRARQLWRLLSQGDRKSVLAQNVDGDDAAQLADFICDLRHSLDPSYNLEYSRLLVGLQEFLSRTYWSRIWVVQEISAASSVSFVLGAWSISSEAVHRGARLLRNFRKWQLMMKREFKIDKSLREIDASDSQGYQQVPLLESNEATDFFRATSAAAEVVEFFKVTRAAGELVYILTRSRHYKSTDPRDQIFALLGIAGDSERFLVAPDYSKSCAQIYTESTRALLKHGYMDVLCHCSNSNENVIQVPTWVPDWSRPVTRWPMQERGIVWKDAAQRRMSRKSAKLPRGYNIPGFRVSGSLQQPAMELPERDGWSLPLQLSVIEACTIKQVGRAWQSDGHSAWLYDLQTLANSEASTLKLADEKQQAIWRTAVSEHELLYAESPSRLSAELVEHLVATLSGRCLSTVDGQTLTHAGFGLYAESMVRWANGRRPFLTNTGKLGCGPEFAGIDDKVVIVLGAHVPFILRECTSGSDHTVLGDAYVHGYMNGELATSCAAIERVTLI